jgi:endo-alpha-N-acetylgalactosaminidase
VVSPDGSTASYQLTFADLPGVQLDASLKVERRVTTFRIDAVRDSETSRVHTLEVPNHGLVSVASGDAGATTAFTLLDPDSTRTADRIVPVTASTPADPAPVGAAYAFVNTDGLAAGIETNSSYDKPSGASVDDGARFWHQARKGADGTVRVGVWSGQWTYRGDTSPYTEPLPWAKVVVTPDANGDKAVDWQDGAIAFRSITSHAPGSEQTKDRVITHIPFNFASQATHPFLRTLDDVKRISLATDNLGQLAVLKGYGSEGHDSAHPDYGGNYNTRAGGLKDLNTLASKGKAFNTSFGVHVNATESYPEANAFSEDLVDKGAKGWNWLNQSYYIKQRPDLASGNIARRFQQLRDETDKNLNFLYIDVYYQSGWLADSLSRQLAAQGWQIGTEWSDRFERSSLWSHWANDLDYGGATNKGLNSKIIRFVRNHEKDTWNNDPILGQPALVDFEGWTGEVDWNEFYGNVWTRNLPAKFLQQQKITDWNDGEIRFSGGVRGTVAGGKRSVYVGAAKVLDDKTYLLPWADPGKATPNKLYHYNPGGGRTTWTLPAPFTAVPKFDVYKLTDTGRMKVGSVAAKSGAVTLNAAAGQPYVLYPAATPPAPVNPAWGAGSHLADPGFNAGNLGAWHPAGPVGIDRLPTGAHVGSFGIQAASVQQRITGLTAGKTYSASVWLEIQPGRSRATTLDVIGGAAPAAVTVQRSTAKNLVAADEKHGDYYQRARVVFTATGPAATLRLRTGAGDAKVRFDDARVVETTRPTAPGATVFEDFENVDQGWGPFVKGDAGGSTDPRTSMLHKHAPYTQAGWNGKLVDDVLNGEWSLKAHEENEGLVYRTTPATVPFVPGHKYEVSFRHASGRAGYYSWVRGTDRIVDGAPVSSDVKRIAIGEQRTPATFTDTFVAGCGGDNWVGLRKHSDAGDQADLIMDDFTVRDLGPTGEVADCTATAISGGALNGMVSGEANPVNTTFTNNGDTPVTGVTLALAGPDGWTATATTPAAFASVAAGQTVTTSWAVTPPAGATQGSYPLTATSRYTVGGQQLSTQVGATAKVLPAGTIPQSRMKVHSVSSDELPTGGEAAKAIDGDPSTHWHTAWSTVDPPAAYPHWIVLDLGASYNVDGFAYLPRQVGTNGRMKDYQLYVSDDPQNWGTPVSTGSFTIGTAETRLNFTATPGRYLRLVGLNAQNGGAFGGAAELNAFGSKR